MKKYLIYGFALLGFATFIFLACSVAEPEPVEPPQDTQVDVTLQNDYGKYQISSPLYNVFHVLDTETGVVKTYYADNSGWTDGIEPYELLYTTQTN